jgi:hypothetical protein
MINEFDQVALTVDIPEFHLKVGDVGTVVDITPNGKQYTLEFFNFDRQTVAVVPVQLTQIRAVGSREITHARVLDEAS